MRQTGVRRAGGIVASALVATASACVAARAPEATPVTAAAMEAPPCRVPVSEAAERPWREVRARGFTFCVPADWRPVGRARVDGVDAATWRGDGGSITWGSGAHRPRQLGTAVAVVRAGEPLPAAPGQVRRFAEVIDGRSAQLWDNIFDGTHYTGAEWGQPAVYLQGEATSPATARLQIAVYRTVRFIEP